MYDTNYLAHHLRRSTIDKPSSLFATQSNGTEVTYAELFANAESLASVLQENGLQPGDRVAVQVAKSITTVELYLATLLAGGVFLPLNTDYTLSELSYFLSDATPTVVVCAPDKLAGLNEVIDGLSLAASLFSLSNDGLSGSLVDAQQQCDTPYQAVARESHDLAAILYTSGTTGRSKGAMLSHRALASNAQTLAEHWRFEPQDRLIHALPVFHIHGLFVAINITLSVGSSLHFMPKFDADEIVAAMPNATVLMGVPTFYVRLLKHPQLNAEVASHMRLFVSGSAPLLEETHRLWKEQTGHEILERYGMTETNMNTSNPYIGARKPGTVGKPLPGVEVKVCDPSSGEELAQGEIGQIEVRGPNVFSGYWKMPEKTALELRGDGWFQTGDLAFVDSDGYITIVGRSKDMIISGGYNVYPKEIEAVIDDVAGVSESAVIGVAHADFGEAVVALVVTEPDATVTTQQVLSACSHQLAKFKQPKAVYLAQSLPRNTMGKVQKAQLRERYKDTFSATPIRDKV